MSDRRDFVFVGGPPGTWDLYIRRVRVLVDCTYRWPSAFSSDPPDHVKHIEAWALEGPFDAVHRLAEHHSVLQGSDRKGRGLPEEWS